MRVEEFVKILGSDFYTGVPDSQLKSLCDYLMDKYGTDGTHHIIAANEGNCTALAAGYHLGTGKVPVVYMQNSGEGNIINPVASLMNEKVYGIPCIFVIGWRGEPGVHDEPQHIFQGEITLRLLEDMGIAYCIVDSDTTAQGIESAMSKFQDLLALGKQVAFVIKKSALTYEGHTEYKNSNSMIREGIIRRIIDAAEDDPIVSTTGKASRELFELREARSEGHGKDFLTVGSMGHSSSIALGLALSRPDKKLWIIDGDGALLMHMGSMAVIGTYAPSNLIHIVINNAAHESVGGQPTVADQLDIIKVAGGCGYPRAISANNYESLEQALAEAKASGDLYLIEAKSAIGSRKDLGRPTTTAMENKMHFMEAL